MTQIHPLNNRSKIKKKGRNKRRNDSKRVLIFKLGKLNPFWKCIGNVKKNIFNACPSFPNLSSSVASQAPSCTYAAVNTARALQFHRCPGKSYLPAQLPSVGSLGAEFNFCIIWADEGQCEKRISLMNLLLKINTFAICSNAGIRLRNKY